jgi:hypothetical protein
MRNLPMPSARSELRNKANFVDNKSMTQQITITKPDDWHLHVRDGAALNTVVPHTAAEFGRAIIMPNLKPPVTTAAQALEYKQRILAAVPKGMSFEPLMTLYLTDNLPATKSPAPKTQAWSPPSFTQLVPPPTAMPA